MKQIDKDGTTKAITKLLWKALAALGLVFVLTFFVVLVAGG